MKNKKTKKILNSMAKKLFLGCWNLEHLLIKFQMCKSNTPCARSPLPSRARTSLLPALSTPGYQKCISKKNCEAYATNINHKCLIPHDMEIISTGFRFFSIQTLYFALCFHPPPIWRQTTLNGYIYCNWIDFLLLFVQIKEFNILKETIPLEY